MLAYKTMASPVGPLRLVGGDAGLRAVLWAQEPPSRVRIGDTAEQPDHPLLCRSEAQLHEYFAGRRTRFELPLDFIGTAFQKRVWAALLTIPHGETRSYAQIATQIGSPKAVRAVGAANGRNPISIITPCHRVIGNDGRLTGFAGGLANKRFLLLLEGSLS